MKQKAQRNTGNQTRGSEGSEEKDWIRTQCQEIETFLNKNNNNNCHSFLWNYLTLKRQSRLQKTTFINIFSLIFRENNT